jgi:hypothetical protein
MTDITLTAEQASIASEAFENAPDEISGIYDTFFAGLTIGRAEAKGEPVAWIRPDHLAMARKAPALCRVEPTQREPDLVPIYTAPQQPEPSTHLWDGEQEFDLADRGDLIHAIKCVRNGLLEYSWIERTLTRACEALQQPETNVVAADLSDSAIWGIWNESNMRGNFYAARDFARAVIAAHEAKQRGTK